MALPSPLCWLMTTPGHRFEHLAGAHDRPRVELPGGDRALAGRLRDADQVLGRVLDVGEVGERALAGDGDVGAQRQVQDDVDATVPPAGATSRRAATSAKLIEREDELVAGPAARASKRYAPLRIGVGRGARPSAAVRKLDRHARQRAAAFRRATVPDTCGRLRRGVARGQAITATSHRQHDRRPHHRTSTWSALRSACAANLSQARRAQARMCGKIAAAIAVGADVDARGSPWYLSATPLAALPWLIRLRWTTALLELVVRRVALLAARTCRSITRLRSDRCRRRCGATSGVASVAVARALSAARLAAAAIARLLDVAAADRAARAHRRPVQPVRASSSRCTSRSPA